MKPSNPNPTGRNRRGFALVATLFLMILLTILAIGLLSLSAVSLRASSRGQAQAEARANARVALMMALGQLQESAGPDRRISGGGGFAGDQPHNPHWTGIWSTTTGETLPAWLVSGNEGHGLEELNSAGQPPGASFTPQSQPDDSWFVFHSSAVPGESVSAPTVRLEDGGPLAGRYAWWVSDEGAKARVDVTAPGTVPTGNAERTARSLSPQENGIRQIAPVFERLASLANAAPDAIDRRRMVSQGTIDLLGDGNGQALSRQYFHDLTTGGYGLPVNVVKGGMKTDLSIAFDSSQSSSGYLEEIIGAEPVLAGGGSSNRYHEFRIRRSSTITDPETFHLIPGLLDRNNRPTGPNWGILYNYAELWRGVSSDGSMRPITMSPVVETDMRSNTWAPYRSAGWDNLRRDRQHTNSAVSPVLSMVQIGFRIASVRRSDGSYQLQLQIKPVIGIWNPYNVRIRPHQYRIKWALYPYLRIGVETPDGNQYQTRTWMRTLWKKSGMPVNPDDPNADVFFDLRSPANIDLQPGEIRLFSVASSSSLNVTNNLVSSWNEDGAFRIDLVDQTNAGAAQPVIVPAGSRVWYEDLMLLDVQHPDTRTRFGDKLSDGNTASWFSLESRLINDGAIHRISDFWQTPKSTVRDELPYLIPEPVSSPSPQVSVADITNSGSPLHIGTWRCFSRNARDAHETQGMRGWVDSNPRCGPGNPFWDGSQPVGADGYEGWHFLSSFIGGSTDDEPYDGGPPGRGKVAEGQNEAPASPEATMAGGRYLGYGGFSSSSSGQTHVPVFDVPRAPLVSLGQLQHAQFSRYQYEPSLPFGNSYATPRIPLDQTEAGNFMGVADFTMCDISHGLNKALWDDFFFSTIGRDYVAPGSTEPLDSVLDFAQLAKGSQTLPNPRYTLRAQAGDVDFDGVLNEAGTAAPRAIAARIGIEGAFNVNSTSVGAWKAVLSSMADLEFPQISVSGATATWTSPTGIRFPKFGHVMTNGGWQPADGGQDADFWRGYRRLSAEEIDALATEIVSEVKLRGPFRSFADFVNRDPASNYPEQQRKGALQAALDRSLNADLDGARAGDPVAIAKPEGDQFSDAFYGENQAAGFAGYLMQGDLLQSLAPVLQVRSDYFRIRAAGQCLDDQGRVIAEAVCEAYVQRTARYSDPGASPELDADSLSSDLNKRFGRHFEIASFRWLSKGEL